MKINHKKLNVVLEVVIILMAGWFVIFNRNIVKKCENAMSEDNEKSEVVNSGVRGDKGDQDIADRIELPELKYKDIFSIDVEKYNKLTTKGVIDFVNFVTKDKLSIHKNEVESFGFKYGGLITKGVIVRNVPVAMRSNADVVVLDIWNDQNKKQRFVLTFKYICKGSGCGWIYRPVEELEMEGVIVKLLTEQYFKE